MRVETKCYTKKSPIRYNIVVQATIVRKDGDFNYALKYKIVNNFYYALKYEKSKINELRIHRTFCIA